MTQTQLKEKVLNLEAQLKQVKKALAKEPDFTVDEKVWDSVRGETKKTRKVLFKKFYGKR